MGSGDILEPEAIAAEVRSLVEDYRDQCLWFLRQDFVPQSAEEILQILGLIERYGDRAGFERAQRLRQWLLTPSSAKS